MHYFHLFQPKNNKQYNKTLLSLFLLCTLVICFLLLGTNYILFKNILFILIILIGCYVVFMLMTNKKRYHFIAGKFIGNITFSNDGITIHDEFIPYQSIEKITFYNHDFLGKFDTKSIFTPSVSIGVENKMELITKNKKVYNHQFQQQHEYELFKAFKHLDKNKTTYTWQNNTLNN